MDRKAAEKAILDYEALVDKAVLILNSSGPPWGYVSNTEWARLTFDGDMAVVNHPQADTYYDSITIELETEKFLAELLFMSDADLAAWKKEALRLYEIEQTTRASDEKAKQEATERATLEALKLKYE